MRRKAWRYSEILSDALVLAGTGAFTVACWWVWPPLGLAVLGLCLGAYGVMIGVTTRVKRGG